MQYEIRWSEPSVTNGQLSVPVSVEEPATLPRWREIFHVIAHQQLPGVPYSLADMWGRVEIDGHAVITVDQVSDRVVQPLRSHLHAAVDRTTEARQQEVQEREHQEDAARAQASQDAERDQKLTDLFREGN